MFTFLSLAPAPTSVSPVLATKCMDKNYHESKWYQSRPRSKACHSFTSFDDPELAQKGISADNVIFNFQVRNNECNLDIIYAIAIDLIKLKSSPYTLTPNFLFHTEQLRNCIYEW